MNSIWKVGAAALTVALLGGFYLGRVVSDPGPLPAVGQPVTVGATVEPTPAAAETPTLHPRHEKTTPDRPGKTRTTLEDSPSPDDHGRNRGSGGGGGGGDVESISPHPSVETEDDGGGFDDHGGGSNSGPG